MKKQRGITLLALVITVIIIIILSTVAINFLFGENGLITRTQQAAQMSDIENVREKLEMAKGTAVIDGKGYIDPDHYFDIIYEEGIIGDRENDVIDNGDGTYEVTTVEGYIFIITLLPTPEEAKDIDIEYSGTVDGPRIVSIKADGTTNSIIIEVEARNADGATYTYEYSISGEESWQEAEQSKNNTCTINDLIEGETYDIRVTVTTNDGSVTRGTSVHLGELPEGTITFGEVQWQGDGTASVTVNTSAEGYRLQYQINAIEDDGWIDIDSGGTVSNLTYPSTVYARIWDGTNGSEHASETLEDKTAPSVNVTPEGTTSNSVSVSATASDGQSGMKDSLIYTYSIKVTGEADSTYTTPSTADAIASNSYTFTGLTQGTNYTVRVQVNGDLANNIGIGTLGELTTGTVGGASEGLITGNIIASNPTWSNGTASITLTTSTGLQIQYQTNSTTGQWTTISSGGQVTGLNHNDTVYARLTDGNNYGDYASVTISDATPPTISNISTSNITYNSATVTVTASDGQSGLATSGTYKYYLNSESTPRGTSTSNSYTFTGLTDGIQYTIKVVVADKAGNEATETRTVSTIERQDVLPVTPSISDGMTPVKWNGSNWIKCSTEFKDWYDYENKEWANVVLGDASWNGDTLNESANYSMLVWIPRYAYQITSQYHQSGSGAGNINIVFIDTNNQNKAKTQTYSESYPSVSGSSMSSYVVHPAFNYGGTKLAGFWVGKYETSNTAQTTGNNTTYTAMIKAGVPSWRGIQVKNIYTVCRNMNNSGNPYGLNISDSVVDPHMMKNSEWGAVAYLSRNTIYGKGSEVWINNSSTFITGNAGNSVSASSASGVTNVYDEGNGPQASTTGNVTGIYDMSGGANEYIAAYINNGDSHLRTDGSTLIDETDTKYKDVYSVTSSDSSVNNYTVSTPANGHYGDAVYETSSGSDYADSKSWYSDYSYFPGTVVPFFLRGGTYHDEAEAGVFAFDCGPRAASSRYGFRVALPVL